MNALLMKSDKPTRILCYNRLTLMNQGRVDKKLPKSQVAA